MILNDLTILMSVKNRIEIIETLLYLDKQFKEHKPLEILIVSQDNNIQYLEESLKDLNTINDFVKIIHCPQDMFNKSLALNIGIGQSKGKKILQLDVDIQLNVLNLKKMVNHLIEDTFVILKEIKESEEDVIEGDIKEFKFALGFKISNMDISVDTSKYYFNNGTKMAPGMILAWKKDLEDIQGYDSNLEGYGFEDIDLIIRLKATGRKLIEAGYGIHLTQIADKTRRRSDTNNLWYCVDKYHIGNFYGTMNQDIQP